MPIMIRIPLVWNGLIQIMSWQVQGLLKHAQTTSTLIKLAHDYARA